MLDRIQTISKPYFQYIQKNSYSLGTLSVIMAYNVPDVHRKDLKHMQCKKYLMCIE